MKTKNLVGTLVSAGLVASGAVVSHQAIHNEDSQSHPIQNYTLLTNHTGDNNTGEESGYGYVDSNSAAIPLYDVNGDIISTVSNGQMLKLGYQEGTRVSVKDLETGVSGFISSAYVGKILNSSESDINQVSYNVRTTNISTQLHLRNSPSMDGEIIGELSNNITLKVIGTCGQWLKVESNGTTGYVFGYYTSKSPDGSGFSENSNGVFSVNPGNTPPNTPSRVSIPVNGNNQNGNISSGNSQNGNTSSGSKNVNNNGVGSLQSSTIGSGNSGASIAGSQDKPDKGNSKYDNNSNGKTNNGVISNSGIDNTNQSGSQTENSSGQNSNGTDTSQTGNSSNNNQDISNNSGNGSGQSNNENQNNNGNGQSNNENNNGNGQSNNQNQSGSGQSNNQNQNQNNNGKGQKNSQNQKNNGNQTNNQDQKNNGNQTKSNKVKIDLSIVSNGKTIYKGTLVGKAGSKVDLIKTLDGKYKVVGLLVNGKRVSSHDFYKYLNSYPNKNCSIEILVTPVTNNQNKDNNNTPDNKNQDKNKTPNNGDKTNPPNDKKQNSDNNGGDKSNTPTPNKIVNNTPDNSDNNNNDNGKKDNKTPHGKTGSLYVMVDVDGNPNSPVGNKLGYMSVGEIGSPIKNEGIKLPAGYKITGVQYVYSSTNNPNFGDLKNLSSSQVDALKSNNKSDYPFKTYKTGQIVIVYNISKVGDSTPSPNNNGGGNSNTPAPNNNGNGGNGNNSTPSPNNNGNGNGNTPAPNNNNNNGGGGNSNTPTPKPPTHHKTKPHHEHHEKKPAPSRPNNNGNNNNNNSNSSQNQTGSLYVMVTVNGNPSAPICSKIGYLSSGKVGTAIKKEGLNVPPGYKIKSVQYVYSSTGNPNFNDLKTLSSSQVSAMENNNQSGYPFKTYKVGQIVLVYNLVKTGNSTPAPNNNGGNGNGNQTPPPAPKPHPQPKPQPPAPKPKPQPKPPAPQPEKSISPFEGYTTGSNTINIESSPNGSTEDTVNFDTPVKVVGEQGNYYKVEYNGQTGYIEKSAIANKIIPRAQVITYLNQGLVQDNQTTQQEIATDNAIAQKAAQICQGSTSQYEMAQKLYIWIAQNIVYDNAILKTNNWDNATVAPIVFKTHTAICTGFAQLYADMCRAVGIKCQVVGGVTNGGQIGKPMKDAHAWNQVYIPGRGWFGVDCCFAASAYTPKNEGGAGKSDNNLSWILNPNTKTSCNYNNETWTWGNLDYFDNQQQFNESHQQQYTISTGFYALP